jgi:Histidine kinase-, DNA gyrase B-, and HSP90-like ATPase
LKIRSPEPGGDFKLEREDWSLFRTIEGLQQRAGVPKERLRRLVLKELADNGLDNDARVRVGELTGGSYFVEDNGTGIDPEEVARLFSIARPMVSTKLWRLPTRGALGNGLRVVAGAVLASGGSLTVITRNRRIELRPERDGTTAIVSNESVDFPVGTRVEIGLGTLPDDRHALHWARIAIAMGGKSYAGKTSPHWYDAAAFHELLYASGARPVRDLIANLDGCSGGKAGEIVSAARLGRATCISVTREQAEWLLQVAQEHARPVNAGRLTGCGGDLYDAHTYASQKGDVDGIPYLVEAWVWRTSGKTYLEACVNRTPVTGELHASRDKREINAFGCGLSHTIATAPKDKHFSIVLNIITPYMPITSDGKAPNLKVFFDPIVGAIENAVRKAHIPSAKGRSIKSVVLDNLSDAIAQVSNDGQYRFNQRQILYALRPVVMARIGKVLTTEYFNQVITDFEDENGEISGMYREPRGSIYHPHLRDQQTLGTLMVESYERPE